MTSTSAPSTELIPGMADPPKGALYLPVSSRSLLEPHLPPKGERNPDGFLFTTLTFATSLDSSLAFSPDIPTALSGPQAKAMTHYLRSRHDAILIGVGTAVTDNPALNCRFEGVGPEGQPRPIIIDPTARWDFSEESKMFTLASEGRGRAPYIITVLENPPTEKKAILDKYGGKFITLKLSTTDVGGHRIDWKDILRALTVEGLKSVMIEGGRAIINSLLLPHYLPDITSVIITITPTWLGEGGVVVSPQRRLDENGNPIAAVRLRAVEWHPFGEDVVLCGKVKF
ncbi:MAG: 2,5-diamino-6-(ribosylamino)-4(3H)-pyrimidinone 5'-phosphate reductase [Geoglossum simile]|nr:MAG: 2,5-diamino-6-(ribosylamino)-4(3H)-pyrimidinone 5'-phosphate reductase [Geoglossum simile]